MKRKKIFYRAIAVLAATALCFTCLFGCSRETRNEDTYPAELEALGIFSNSTADARGREIIRAIEARSTYAEEDWLIIISTDHGGTETGHGGQTAFERMTWLACNKPIEITEENKTYARTK